MLAQLKRYDEAISTLRRALTLDEKSLGLHHPDLAYDLVGLGHMLDVTGKHAEAVTVLERSLALPYEGRADSHYQAMFYLGQARYANPKDHARGRKLVSDARDGYKREVPDAQGLAATEKWLATHP